MPPLLQRVPAPGELGRSVARCGTCGRPLAPILTAPVLPWLVAGGRCAGCGAGRPRWCAGVELVTGLTFGLAAAQAGWSATLPPVLSLFAGLVAMSAVDIWAMRIPARFAHMTAVAVGVTIVVATAVDSGIDADTLRAALVGAAVLGGGLLVLHLISPRMLGFGDVRLATVAGLVVGWLAWTPEHPVLGPVRGRARRRAAWWLHRSPGGHRPAGHAPAQRPVPFRPLAGGGGGGGDSGFVVVVGPSVSSCRAPVPHRRRIARPRPRGHRRGAARRAADHGRGDPGASWPAAASATAAGPRMRFEQDEVTLVGGVRHGRTLGSPVAIEIGNTEWARSDKWHEEMSVAPGEHARRRSPSPGPATPTWPACRSTASPTPATCSSGPRPARRRPGWRPAPWPRRCCGQLGVEIVSHVIQIGLGAVEGGRAPGARRPRPGRRVAGALLRPRGRGGRWSRRSRRRPRRATASAASSRCWPTACPSAWAATSTGTASSTACWPRRS